MPASVRERIVASTQRQVPPDKSHVLPAILLRKVALGNVRDVQQASTRTTQVPWNAVPVRMDTTVLKPHRLRCHALEERGSKQG